MDLKNIPVKVLRDMCLKNRLSTRGTKAILCKRLHEYDTKQIGDTCIRPNVQTIDGVIVATTVPFNATFGDLNAAVAAAIDGGRVKIYHTLDGKLRKYRPDQCLCDVGIDNSSTITVVRSVRHK